MKHRFCLIRRKNIKFTPHSANKVPTIFFLHIVSTYKLKACIFCWQVIFSWVLHHLFCLTTYAPCPLICAPPTKAVNAVYHTVFLFLAFISIEATHELQKVIWKQFSWCVDLHSWRDSLTVKSLCIYIAKDEMDHTTFLAVYVTENWK